MFTGNSGIRSVDRSTSALFQVPVTDTDSIPTKTELVFNKYGNRYFLSKLFQKAALPAAN
jgi:hypothetical protein